MKNYKKKLGDWGEELARKFLEKKGYNFVERKWQKRFGEIDLIFTKEKELIFVEVKTRMTNNFGWGEQAVDQRKKNKISVMIDLFFIEYPNFERFYPRCDIVVVEFCNTLRPKFIHYENITLGN